MSNYKNVRTLVKECPYLLESVKDSKLLKVANSMMPKSVGLEFECALIDENTKEEVLDLLTNVQGVITFHYTKSETSFRIAEGYKGMIALYKVLEIFKRYYAINPSSGIHYHVSTMLNMDNLNDRVGHVINPHTSTPNFLKWSLNALDRWGYKGQFNERKICFNKEWIKLHTRYDTIEYRIGKMTFEYSKIMKRILNVQNITIKLENQLAVINLLYTFSINYWAGRVTDLKSILSTVNVTDSFKNNYIKKTQNLFNKVNKLSFSQRNFDNAKIEIDEIMNDILKNHVDVFNYFKEHFNIDRRSVLFTHTSKIKSNIKL